jgi:hypothetical protein
MGSPFAPRKSDTYRIARPPLAWFAALVLMACGDGARGRADASDASSPTDAAADVATGVDATGADTVAPLQPIRGAPLPPGVPPPRRILDGNVILTGDGPSTCSHQQPASGDGHRWCAFARPGAPGATELWVFDLSALAGGGPNGAPLTCDGTSPACRRLSAALWTGSPLGGPSHPYSHAFDGDTLVFYADGSAGGDRGLHRGPVYAWRPGWPAARLLSSATGLLCRGHARAPLAHCLDDLVGDPLRPDSFELRAGDLAGSGPLPSLGRVSPLTPDGESAWQVGFTPDGDGLGLSSPATDPSVPVLRLHPIVGGTPGPAVPLARDVRNWKFSHDGRRVYLVRQPPGGAAELSVLGLAAGATPEVLATGVQNFELIGDGSADRGVAVLVLEAGRRVLRLVGDPQAPGVVTGVFTHRGTPEAVRVSFDGKLTAWITDDFTGRLVRHADQAICLINTRDDVEVFRLGFLGNARLLIWTESAPDDVNRRDVFFAPPGDCRQSTRFGHGVHFLHPVGERGLVLGDELEESAERLTLKVVATRTRDGRFVLDEPLRVDEKVGQYITVASEQPLLVLYRKDGQGPEVDGVYLFGPAPF